MRSRARAGPAAAGSTPVIDGPQAGHFQVSVSKAQTSSADAAIRRDTENSHFTFSATARSGP